MEVNPYAKQYERPRGTREDDILDDLSVAVELKLLPVLPTIRDVCRGYEWRFHQLKNGGENPKFCAVASLLELDIKQSWEKASLANFFCPLQDFV